MGLSEGIAIGSFALAIAGFLWKLSLDVQKITRWTEEALKNMETDLANKRNRLYERMDEVKISTEQHFVRKDLCEVMHKSLVDRMTEGFRNLEAKIDALIKRQA